MAYLVAAILALLGALDNGGPGGGKHPHTPTITTTATSTSSCTMTATATPIVIVTTLGTDEKQFDSLLGSLPKTANPRTFTNTNGHWWMRAILNQCDSEALWDNPIVEAMAIDNFIVANDNVAPLTKLPSIPAEDIKREQKMDWNTMPAGSIDLLVNISGHDAPFVEYSSAKKKRLDPTSHVMRQGNSPDNLKWISGLPFQHNLLGPYLNYEDYIYDDGEGASTILPSWIYYLDGSGFANHAVCSPSTHLYVL